jgi:hypothetical protein
MDSVKRSTINRKRGRSRGRRERGWGGRGGGYFNSGSSARLHGELEETVEWEVWI